MLKTVMMCEDVRSSGSRERAQAYIATKTTALSLLPLERTSTRCIIHLQFLWYKAPDIHFIKERKDRVQKQIANVFIIRLDF